MARFRHVVPEGQWKQTNEIARKMGLAPKDLFNTCAGIGLQFFALSLNPPPELMRSAFKAVRKSPKISEAVEESLRSLSKTSKAAAKKKK